MTWNVVIISTAATIMVLASCYTVIEIVQTVAIFS